MRRLRLLIRVGLPALALVAWAAIRCDHAGAGRAARLADAIAGHAPPRIFRAEFDATLPLPCPAIGSQQTVLKDGTRCGRARSRGPRLLAARAVPAGGRGPVDCRAHTLQLDRLDYAAALSIANAGRIASRSNAPPPLAS